MTYQKISIHSSNLGAAKRTFQKYAPTEQEYKAVLEHLRELSNGEVTGKPISEKRQIKILSMFGVFFKHYKKQSNTITREELSKFKENLLNNNILKQNGNHYADTTKEDLTEIIVRYLEWKYPKRISSFMSKTRQPLRRWFVTRGKKKTPEVLTEQEIKQLYKEAKTLWQKYLIAILFGSGARIEEFLNFRHEDWEEPTKNFPYYKIDIKEEYSKTEGRKIGLYWDYCTEAVAKYLASVEIKNQTDRVLEKEYDAIRMFLRRLGEKVLNKRVHPHIFRKSSATFYASKLNRQQLCVKFGWKFKSDMPDIYISRAGVDEVQVKDVMLNDDISVLRKEQQEQKIKYESEMEGFKQTQEESNKVTEKLILEIHHLQEKAKIKPIPIEETMVIYSPETHLKLIKQNEKE